MNRYLKYNRPGHIIILFFLIISCQPTPKQEVIEEGFSINDTMMSRSELFTAELQNVKDQIRLFGKIQADNKKLAHVYSVVGGNVLIIKVELGDYVKKGQILAVIRSSEVAGFQKEYLNAKSQKAVAEKNLQVAKDLYAGKLASEKDVVAAEREMDNAIAELERMKEIYGIYNLQSNSIFNITAPISGFIMQKDINQGEQLRPDKSDVLFSIAEINEVWATANVNESDISRIQLGYDAEVSTLSFKDEKYKGKIDKIFNAIDPETKAMKVRVKIPNESFKLKPEMNATVTVSYEEQRKMVAIPSSSVIFDKSKNWVMVYHNQNKIETRKIEVYRQVSDIVYISSGLNVGEKVISKYGNFIYDAIND